MDACGGRALRRARAAPRRRQPRGPRPECSGFSAPAEVRGALLYEGRHALDEILAARHLLLQLRLELELLAHARVQPVVELALGARVGARGPRGKPRGERRGLRLE